MKSWERKKERIRVEVKVASFRPVVAIAVVVLLAVGYIYTIEFIAMLGSIAVIFYLGFWVLWRVSYWDAYVSRGGVTRHVETGGYRAGMYLKTLDFYQGYEWSEVRYYEVRDHGFRLHFDRFSLWNMLFFVDVYLGSGKREETKRKRIEGWLRESNVSLGRE